MDYRERIAIDPSVRRGKPCIRGTRIAVGDVFGYLWSGMSIPDVLDELQRSRLESRGSRGGGGGCEPARAEAQLGDGRFFLEHFWEEGV